MNGEAVLVEQLPDAANQQHLMALIIAAVAAPLDGLQLGKFLFPIPQYMWLDAT